MDLCSSCCSWKVGHLFCWWPPPTEAPTDTTLTIDRELGSSRYCFRLRLFPFTWNTTGWRSNQTGPTLTVRGTQLKHRPASGCRSSWGRHRRCLWTAGTQTRTAGAETKNMDLCYWCWCLASLCWLIHPWEVVELDPYLLSCIHGDGQAVWHQASSLVLLHQPYRHHRYTHLTSLIFRLKKTTQILVFLVIFVNCAHLDVFTKQVCVETQPVPGDVESSLQQDVSEQSTRIN